MVIESSADIKRYLLQKCSTLGIPVSGIFELTPRCNLKCKMCYVRLTKEQMAPLGRELTADEWIELGQQCKDAGMAFLLITGGEPTIRKDFAEIYSALAQMGLSITVNTNATNLSDEIKELWQKLPPAQVNVTVYGVCREDYGDLCQNPDAFDKVQENLQWLKNQGILVHLNTTVVPANYPKWTEIEEFAKNGGYELRMTAYCFPPSRRNGCSDFDDFMRLSPDKAGELTVLDILYREGKNAVKARAANLCSPIQRSCELDNSEPIQCMAGSSQFWVSWNGFVTPCGMLDKPNFSVTEKGFNPAWEKLKSQCKKIRLCPECANCEHQKSCMNCVAVTYAETGRFDGKPQYMCDFNKAYREALIKYSE